MSVQWFYQKNGQKLGPVKDSDLKELATAGEIGPQDLVQRIGMQEWVSASRVKGLFPAGSTVPPADIKAPAIFKHMVPPPLPRAKAKDPSDAVPSVDTSATRHSIIVHLLKNFTRSRWSYLFVVPLALIFAVGLDWSKPFIGYHGMWGIYLGILLFTAIAAIAFIIQGVVSRALANDGSARNERRSWTARFAHFGLVTSLALFPILAAEYLGPPHGFARTAVSAATGKSPPRTQFLSGQIKNDDADKEAIDGESSSSVQTVRHGSDGQIDLTVDKLQEEISVNWTGIEISPKTRFYGIFSKPKRITTIGDDTYLYYDCSDGSVVLKCNSAMFQYYDTIYIFGVDQIR